jgi:hypothetical protein
MLSRDRMMGRLNGGSPLDLALGIAGPALGPAAGWARCSYASALIELCAAVPAVRFLKVPPRATA